MKQRTTQMQRLKVQETQLESQEQQPKVNYQTKTETTQVLPIETTRNNKDMF